MGYEYHDGAYQWISSRSSPWVASLATLVPCSLMAAKGGRTPARSGVRCMLLSSLAVGFKFINQPHFFLHDAINQVANIPASSVCEILNLIL